jgi:hypothetical protein
VLGAFLNPVAGKLGDLIGVASKKISGKLAGMRAEDLGMLDPKSIEKAIPELSALPPDVRQGIIDEAIQQIKTTGKLSAEELGRKANLIANGVTPTKSMVTRNPIDWTQERNLQKMGQSQNEKLREVGQELTGAYQANDKALATTLTSQSARLPKGTQEALGQRAMEGVDKVAKDSQKAVRAGYEQVDQTVGGDLASDARQVYATITDPKLLYNPRSKPLVEAVQGYLKHMGMIDGKGALTSKTLTAQENEQLRQFVNTLDDTFGRSNILKAIDADAASGLGSDAYGAARTAAAKRFDTIDNPATQRALNTLGELQQGKTAQSFIKQQIVGGADQDVAALMKTLANDQGGKDAVQAGLMQHLEDVAINVNSGKFSGAAFNKAVEKLGPKLEIVLGADRAGKIRSLARAAIDSTYEPPYSAVNNSNSGTTWLAAMGDQFKRAKSYSRLAPFVEKAKEIAAENTAQQQLRDALAARTNTPALSIDPNIKRLVDALSATAAPGAVIANQSRNKNKKGAKNE